MDVHLTDKTKTQNNKTRSIFFCFVELLLLLGRLRYYITTKMSGYTAKVTTTNDKKKLNLIQTSIMLFTLTCGGPLSLYL